MPFAHASLQGGLPLPHWSTGVLGDPLYSELAFGLASRTALDQGRHCFFVGSSCSGQADPNLQHLGKLAPRKEKLLGPATPSKRLSAATAPDPFPLWLAGASEKKPLPPQFPSPLKTMRLLIHHVWLSYVFPNQSLCFIFETRCCYRRNDRTDCGIIWRFSWKS